MWEVETRIYFVKFVYQGQEWAFIETELKKKLLRGELKIKRSQKLYINYEALYFELSVVFYFDCILGSSQSVCGSICGSCW